MGPRQLTNLPVVALLRSPLHGLLSRAVLLLTYTGRRSGRPVTVPVNYARDGGDLYIFSRRDRLWWRNLRGGAPVRVRLRGRDLPGRGDLCEGLACETRGLRALLRLSPSFRRASRVTLDAEGNPQHPGDLDRLARAGVVIHVAITPFEEAR